MNKLSELQRRDLIISFYKKHEELGKKFTVQHYVTEGISKRLIYHILQKYLARSSTARKAGSGGLNKKMSKAAGAAIVRHKRRVSTSTSEEAQCNTNDYVTIIQS